MSVCMSFQVLTQLGDCTNFSRKDIKGSGEQLRSIYPIYSSWGASFLFYFFHLTYSRWTSSLPSHLWSQRISPSLPGSRLTIFLSRCKFSTLTTRLPMVEFYLLTFPRFPLRKKEHKSYFGKNRTHDFRTSRCAAYLLDHSGDERLRLKRIKLQITDSVSRWLSAQDARMGFHICIVGYLFGIPVLPLCEAHQMIRLFLSSVPYIASGKVCQRCCK